MRKSVNIFWSENVTLGTHILIKYFAKTCKANKKYGIFLTLCMTSIKRQSSSQMKGTQLNHHVCFRKKILNKVSLKKDKINAATATDELNLHVKFDKSSTGNCNFNTKSMSIKILTLF